MPVEITLGEIPAGVSTLRSWSNAAWTDAALRCVVAIPARNEAHRIGRCLDGLARQQTWLPFGVLVLVNDSTDDTFVEVVSRGRRRGCGPLMAVEAALPAGRCDAGAARCVAMHLAGRELRGEGAVFTTDADSVPPPHWIARYSALIDAGYDAVAGLARLLPADMEDIPRSLLHRRMCEDRYEICLDAIESWLDPVDHNPWPRHYQASGANLALSLAAMRRVSSMAWPACGEDKALVRALEASDCRVRHDTAQPVLTSGRLFGRARGGMADTMRKRILEPDSPCDERLETVERAYFRARTRRLLRELHAGPRHAEHLHACSARLRLTLRMLGDALDAGGFGAAWRVIESASPRLARQPILPSQLLAQCARGEALLARMHIPSAWRADLSTGTTP
ncbi:glycosyltransferase family A protein [Dyella japonica]|uniref:Glycosyltransferase 2-like domain-containing protein n=1 Tax=Dyella japonica TaxID=231455 RepID=A0ABV2JWQ6_9GAMM